METGEAIAVIEVLSPKNKQSVVGRLQYKLRQGKPMPMDGGDVLRQQGLR